MLALTVLGHAHEGHLADPNAILLNGDFSEGEGLPSHWLYQPGNEATAQLNLVTDITHDVPTGTPNFKAQAMHLGLLATEPEPNKEVASASISQILRRNPTRAFTISGWLKSSPGVQAQVMLRAKNEDWTQNVLTLDLTANAFAPDAAGWRYFFGSVTLPATANATILALEARGTGSCWLDNVEIVEAPAT